MNETHAFSAPLAVTEVTSQLNTAIPSWEDVAHHFRSTVRYAEATYTRKSLPGILSEIQYTLALQSVAQSSPRRVVVDPIDSYAYVKDYFIFKNRVGQTIVQDRNGYTVCEYDIVSSIDDAPTLYEIKLSRSVDFMHKAIDLDRAYGRATPLRRYFESPDFSYVFVIPPESIDTRLHWFQHLFVASGGIIYPFYTSRKEYFDAVDDVAFEEKLFDGDYDLKRAIRRNQNSLY